MIRQDDLEAKTLGDNIH